MYKFIASCFIFLSAHLPYGKWKSESLPFMAAQDILNKMVVKVKSRPDKIVPM